jgi:hypothetical protein
VEAALLANVQFCKVQTDPWFKMAPPVPVALLEKVQPDRVSRFELAMAPPAKPEAVELPASVRWFNASCGLDRQTHTKNAAG